MAYEKSITYLDRVIKEHLGVSYYLRYMDDLVLIHHSKKYLSVCLDVMKKTLSQLDLSFNSKTHICPIKNGVEFLGARYLVTQVPILVTKVT